MKNIIIMVAIAAAIIGGLVWAGINGRHTANPVGLTFATVSQEVSKGAKLYDVRTPDEYAAGHFSGALNVPLQDLQAGKLPDINKDTIIYVYCHSGNRSGQSASILKQAGYTHVVDLHGLTNVESMGGSLTTS